MNILLFLFALEIGLIPNGHLSMLGDYHYGQVDVDHSWYLQLEAEFCFYDFVFIRSKIISFAWAMENSINFYPDNIEFYFNIGIRKDWYEIGWRHYCKHPILPWYRTINSFSATWEASADEIYIQIKGETKLF